MFLIFRQEKKGTSPYDNGRRPKMGPHIPSDRIVPKTLSPKGDSKRLRLTLKQQRKTEGRAKDRKHPPDGYCRSERRHSTTELQNPRREGGAGSNVDSNSTKCVTHTRSTVPDAKNSCAKYELRPQSFSAIRNRTLDGDRCIVRPQNHLVGV